VFTKIFTHQNTVALFLFVLLCALWALLSQVPYVPTLKHGGFLGPDGFLSSLEDRTIDARIGARGSMDVPVKLCYVDVDTEAISRLGNFPWNREYFASALNALFDHGHIKAAGMDFVFSSAGISAGGREEAEAGNRALGKSLHKNKNVVVAATFTAKKNFPFLFERRESQPEDELPEMPEFPIVGPTWGHVGLIDAIGSDVRYIPFFAKTSSHTYFPLSLKLALFYWGLDDSAVRIEEDELVVRNPEGAEVASVPLVMRQLAEPNWFSAWMEKDHHASILKVIAFGQAADHGTEEEKKMAREFFEPFKDSVVLIGPVDPLLKDVDTMPLSGSQPVPLVSVHGNLFKTLITGRFIERPPVWVNCLLIFALGFGAALFSIVPQRFQDPAKIFGGLVFVGYIVAAFLLFASNDLIIPLVAPLGAAVSCTFVGSLIHLASEQKQKRRIKGMFGTYLSHELVAKMIESGEEPQLGGIDAEITAFFSDVQGFSSFSELLTPQQLVSLMNEYLTAMTDILMHEGCYVDKYIGDAIVGIFNSPIELKDHALKACITTQLLHKRLSEMCLKWHSEGDKWPPFVSKMQVRIGLNTGFATVGNMGSQKRFNYTMMGDSVNLAARCESGAKSYGVYTMVTGETKRAAEAAGDDCVFRFLDKVIVKGRREPVEMYEIVCLRKDLDEETLLCLSLYAEGVEHYQAQRWASALNSFEKSSALERNRAERNPNAPTTPSLLMIGRTRDLMEHPPGEGWNGIYVMKGK
jgi:adenylate cyclase